jgi:2-polyprenyl-6-hydroxyphenyl methylase/3-demethylubiquinone-9 3-methyltransferase
MPAGASTGIGLRPASARPAPCKICSRAAALYGVVDMQRPCEIQGGYRPPLSGVPVYYRRCEACGFLFTDAFDDWSIDEFKTHIYNDAYLLFDPGYETTRPRMTAGLVTDIWSEHKAGMRVLDFGGGNDAFCAALRANGFQEAVTYDPMVPEYSCRPEGKFDLVTCFETMEHLPDPVEGIARIVECLAEPGAVFYSTLTIPDDFDNHGISWWYVGPRNGHISIFTKQALELAWARHGYKTTALNEGIHLAFRTLPANWGMAQLQV